MVHTGGVIGVITFTSSVQVSGVRCQQPTSTRCVGITHKMDILSPVLVFSCNQISVQDSGFTDTCNLTPETITDLIYGRADHL